MKKLKKKKVYLKGTTSVVFKPLKRELTPEEIEEIKIALFNGIYNWADKFK